MARTSTAQGGTGIHKPLLTETVCWPQETQRCEGPENFCILSYHRAKIAGTYTDAALTTPILTSLSHPHSIISVSVPTMIPTVAGVTSIILNRDIVH